MKTILFAKILILLPIVVFANYLLMAIIGCLTFLWGCGDDFYCNSFCLIGKIIFGFTIVVFFFLIFPDIKSITKRLKDTTPAEKQKNISPSKYEQI